MTFATTPLGAWFQPNLSYIPETRSPSLLVYQTEMYSPSFSHLTIRALRHLLSMTTPMHTVCLESVTQG